MPRLISELVSPDLSTRKDTHFSTRWNGPITCPVEECTWPPLPIPEGRLALSWNVYVPMI